MEEEKSMPRLTIMREEDMPSWSARRAVADVNRYEREYSVKSVSLPARSTIEIEVDPLALPSESEERHDSQSLPGQRERSPSDSISVSDEETEEETKKRTETPPLEAHDEEMEAERPSVAPPRYVDAPRLYTTKGAKAHHGGKMMRMLVPPLTPTPLLCPTSH
ncbi:hypothetical protein ADEAN_000520100 [Angomonas deanei]|uniref:Uncharacterized protein n=1 Tax=Angomonas deanei TaxID=59799 RepID=A0A7G2CFH5_9TRYP|nr:hypothetical protein ADEAN_000520100 [Angomonas deanei]